MAQQLHKGGLGGLEAVVWACGVYDEGVCNGDGWWATGGLKGPIAAQLTPSDGLASGGAGGWVLGAVWRQGAAVCAERLQGWLMVDG